MASREDEKGGIVDWQAKYEVLQGIFGYTPKEIVRDILGSQIALRETNQLIDSMYGWGEHKPVRGTWQTEFVRRLVNRLIALRPGLAGQEQHVKMVFFDGVIEDFIALLPENIRQIYGSKYKQATSAQLKIEDRAIQYQDFHRTLSRRFPPLASIRTALNTGRIDQKWHYLTPVAEENWKAVLISGVYEQYEECKDALKKLCRDETVWLDFFRTGQADGVVMLGCGAGSKDAILIRSMVALSPLPKLFYWLVDFSPFMLEAARLQVDLLLTMDQFVGRVKVDTRKFDFVDDFHGVGASILHPEHNVAWMLPGGTLGNLDEKSFFESLARESKVGDLLVIGVETVGTGDKVELADLKKKYDSPQVRRFVEMPFRSLRFAEHIKGKYPEIVVDVVGGYENGHSKIEGTKTVEVSSEIRGKKIVLLTSTRYDETALVEFARGMGFDRKTIVVSTDNPRYKQFVFRKT